MNKLSKTTLVFWQTANTRRTKKIVTLCKNYDMMPLAKNIYAGSLYNKERDIIGHILAGTLNKTTEKWFIFPLCRTCVGDSTVSKELENGVSREPFEIV